jgi:hypothetical protein
MRLMDTVVAVRPGEHACCRLAHAPDRERLARAFVSAGLERDDKVLYFGEHDDLDEFGARLSGDDALLRDALESASSASGGPPTATRPTAASTPSGCSPPSGASTPRRWRPATEG